MTLKDILMFLYFIQGLCGAFGHEFSEDDQVQFVDIFDNVTLPCFHYNYVNTENNTYWRQEGKHYLGEKVLPNGSLFLTNVTQEQNGHYKCLRMQDDRVIESIRLVVRGPPNPPENVTITASTVIAKVTWNLHLEEDWEYSLEGPKTTLHLLYHRAGSDEWQVLPHSIPPSQGWLHIFRLHPNTTYEFQLWTSNMYGQSDNVTVVTTTTPATTENELAKIVGKKLEGFSPNVWIVAVVVVMVVSNVLVGLLIVVYYFQQKLKKSAEADDPEKIELVPHIIENPGYQVEQSYSVETIHESLLSPSTSAQSTAVVV
ncbi:uncharacterized protein LOC121859451 isoform X2 [Homarus americanus]|uniref:uncharacterized protein LOC121859451 isoform X2 n=1 Tax=Homarus americanus TaxID=6706 RepID=UPI001C454720|nr:uncharacterized protein LOC121859451 isoform X2 [Homarus americanus]